MKTRALVLLLLSSTLVSALVACGDDDVGTAPLVDAGLDSGERADAGPRPQTFADIGASTEGLAIGRTPAGDSVMYVGARDGRVVRVTPDGIVTDFAEVDAPVGIAVRASGEVLVCGEDATGSVLFELDPMTGGKTVLVATGPGGVALGLCNYVAVAPDDSLVFSDSAANELYRTAADGSGITRITDAIQYPNGLAFSPDGATLYVASWSGSAVFALSFDRTTGLYGAPTMVVTDIANIDGLVTLSDGELLLVTSGSGLQRITPSGAPELLYGPRLFMLPANGVMGDTAFGANNLYLTSLSRMTIERVTIDTAGVSLPVR